MRNVKTKLAFWTGFIALSLASLYFTITYLPLALQIVNVNISANQEQILEKSRLLAEKHQFKPRNTYKQFASFDTETMMQFYVELEGKGPEEFKHIIKSKIFSPYQWNVRHFRQGEIEETYLAFTPDGLPYGFFQKLPESEAGKNLSVDDAKKEAERVAQSDWNINITQFKQIEASQKEQPSKRIDHFFLYERKDITFGKEGTYRLRIIVSGDRVTSVTQFPQVPEAFMRRYENMREKNAFYTLLGNVCYLLLYILIGCLIGGFFLLRKRYLLYKWPSICAFFLALGTILSSINILPLMWIKTYNTALSTHSFLLQQYTSAILNGLIKFGLLFMIISIAEGLSRIALPHALRLWSVWQSTTGSTLEIAKQTCGSYLYVPLMLAWATGFTYITRIYFCWWIPLSLLTDPNVLATYVPWFNPFINSLIAGVMEECLFRAIPLAGAILIGRYLKRERECIIIGLILQALIFGSLHAFYITFPPYSRIVELFIPSIVFGLLYLRFGLLPGIIIHWIYDLVLMSLPIFTSSAPGSYISKIITIFIGLVPLFVILYRRLQNNSWLLCTTKMFNKSWSSSTQKKNALHKEKTDPSYQKELSSSYVKKIIYLGLLSFVCWIICRNLDYPFKSFTIGRQEAITKAYTVLASHGTTLDSSWKVLCTAQNNPPSIHSPCNSSKNTCSDQTDDQTQNIFVWQTCTRSIYNTLVGTYLKPAHWFIRFVRFEGDVANRSEEFHVILDPQGDFISYAHPLPEGAHGKTLSQQQARTKALEAIKKIYHLSSDDIRELSSIDIKRPYRKDWEFVFQNTKITLPDGKAQIYVSIAGEILSGIKRSIYVPQQWKRAYDERCAQRTIAILVSSMAFFILLTICIAILLQTLLKVYSLSLIFKLFFALFSISLFSCIIMLPHIITTTFSTAQSFSMQLLRFFCYAAIVASLRLLIDSFFVVSMFDITAIKKNFSKKQSFIVGVCSGTILYALYNCIIKIINPNIPWISNSVSHIGTYQPFCSLVLNSFLQYVQYTAYSLIIILALIRLTEKRNFTLIMGIMSIVGITVAGYFSLTTLPIFFTHIIVLTMGIIGVFYFMLQYDYTAIPMLIGTCFVLYLAEQAFLCPYKTLPFESFCTGIILMICAYWWTATLQSAKPFSKRISTSS